jgi:Ni,Fe-hydrogenase I large subunit
MSRRVVGPFNRVEGDLEVHLDIADDRVRDAWVVSPLYRGFERMLHGKDPRDALVYTPRICGICSVSQSVAAALALADAQGLAMPPNGEAAVNLILANENVADHLTHFYLFFMPDFARTVYSDAPWHASVAARFSAVTGAASREVLPARADFMHLMGLLAGKWPHTLAIQPGGTTRSVEAQERTRIAAILFGFRRFLERVLFGDALETIAALDSGDALRAWAARHPRDHSDFCRFLHVAESLGLEKLGRASDAFMSYGVYRVRNDRLFGRGVWRDGGLAPLDADEIREDLSHSWMAYRDAPKHPYDGVTVPDADAKDGYTWCKAPRLGGRVVEVGALARQLIDGQPLIRDLVARGGGNVRTRVIARLLEIARVVIAMETWTAQLAPGEPCCNHAPLPEEAMGCGLIEAARGSLGHWLKIRNGRILNYQIISPTTWNFSPRDGAGTRGALEQALIGAPVRPGETDPVAVQHVVRSFDPCMVCTVH